MDSDTDRFGIIATFNADLPAGYTSLACVWSDTNFEITGDGSSITIDAASASPGYSSFLFGDPQITNGSTASFIGIQPGGGLGSPDPSNPLQVVEFDYAGDIARLDLTLVGQNSFLPIGNPGVFPGSALFLYQDVAGNPGGYSFEVLIVPAPATLALAPAILNAARRRRK
ncbi:MAG: hypothetical protein AAFR96_03235 [Planctomycetota bacterium]